MDGKLPGSETWRGDVPGVVAHPATINAMRQININARIVVPSKGRSHSNCCPTVRA